MAGMACYGTPVPERCRFCGLDLPPDTVAVMTHINNHWRQFNLETLSLSPCAFEPQLDIRVGNTPINPEDLEVSSHFEQGFQYTYSPQTEPSNLTINGARCSPLNLTGRPKSSSPLTSPLLPQPPIAVAPTSHHDHHNHHHHQQHHQHHHQPPAMGTGGAVNMPAITPQHHSYPIGMHNNHHHHQGMVQAPPVHHVLENHMNMEGHFDMHEDHSCEMKRRRRHERVMEMKCEACERIFFTKTSFDERMENPMKDNNTYLITDQMDNNQAMQNVMSCSMEDKPYKCSVCDREFTFREELLEHAESHEAAKPYKCDICGAGLSHVSALRRHRRAHTGYKPHRCEICNRSFFQKCDLQRHYAIHNKSKQFECNVCKKKYSALHFLENHKCKAPEEPKPFKCNICGEGCANNMAWSYHMWKHTKNPIFVPFQDKFSSPLPTTPAETN